MDGAPGQARFVPDPAAVSNLRISKWASKLDKLTVKNACVVVGERDGSRPD